MLSRPASLLVLVGVYVGVSVIAYTDYPRGETAVALTGIEQQGLAVWRRHNCQVCHQLHGFGGFLGPDLTNRVTESTLDVELETTLTSGSGRMPALQLDRFDRQAVIAYLRAVNRTGRSQPRALMAGKTVAPADHYQQLTAAWARHLGRDLPADVTRGLEVWRRQGCVACHAPFTVGPRLAPDITGRATARSVESMASFLDRGVGRMPAYSLSPVETEDLCALLEFLSGQRSTLVRLNDEMLDRESFSWSAVPAFEYP